MWHAVLTLLHENCRKHPVLEEVVSEIPCPWLQGAHILWLIFHTSCALLSDSSVTHGLLCLPSLYLNYNRYDRFWIIEALDIPVWQASTHWRWCVYSCFHTLALVCLFVSCVHVLVPEHLLDGWIGVSWVYVIPVSSSRRGSVCFTLFWIDQSCLGLQNRHTTKPFFKMSKPVANLNKSW